MFSPAAKSNIFEILSNDELSKLVSPVATGPFLKTAEVISYFPVTVIYTDFFFSSFKYGIFAVV